MAKKTGPISLAEVRQQLASLGEIVEDGVVIGYVDAAARYKVAEEHLGHGGFLEVRRDEATREYVANEYDALQDPRTGRLYPGGYSAQGVWRVADLELAAVQVMAYLRRAGLAAES